MIMSYIWVCLVGLSFVCGIITGSGKTLTAALLEGAQSGITLGISIAGAVCLWSGIGRLMEAAGATKILSRLFRPVLYRLFPDSRTDSALAGDLSANICANLLGLGNAATPMGISAARRMKQDHRATDALCRLIVLNTASIQLIPSNVAALRASLGCASPFDILPAVWISSLASASLGLTAAFFLGKVWPYD